MGRQGERQVRQGMRDRRRMGERLGERQVRWGDIGSDRHHLGMCCRLVKQKRTTCRRKIDGE